MPVTQILSQLDALVPVLRSIRGVQVRCMKLVQLTQNKFDILLLKSLSVFDRELLRVEHRRRILWESIGDLRRDMNEQQARNTRKRAYIDEQVLHGERELGALLDLEPVFIPISEEYVWNIP